jgi:hypothetical protein
MRQKYTDADLLKAWEQTAPSTGRCAQLLGVSKQPMILRLRRLGVAPSGPGPQTTEQSYDRWIARSGKIAMHLEDGIAIVFSDAHYWPGLISTAHRALLKFIKDLQPKLIVCNGDAVDGSTISRYPRIGWDNKPNVKDELGAVGERLGEVEAAAGRAALVWPLGNHDARFETHLAAQAPQYEGIRGFSLKDHFPAWKPCWGLWLNDDCVIKHRWKGGIHAVRNNTLSAGRTMVTGHLHSLKVTPYSDYNGDRWGVDTGTLADPGGPQFEDYLEANPTDWRSGFVVLTCHKGKLIDPEMVRVRKDAEVVFRGQVISV